MSGRHLLTLLIILGSLGLGASFLLLGYSETWSLWNIPVMSPYFADLRSITAGAESASMGLDPLQSNPADPWGRAMAYPRIWQALFMLGIDQSWTLATGLLFIFLFATGLVLFARGISRATALWLTLAIFSPAVLLGIERANNDLVSFFLVALFLALLRQRPLTATTTLAAAFALKLYPLFAATALLRLETLRFRQLVGGLAVLAIVYLGFTLSDVLLIQQHTLRGTFYAYGVATWSDFISQSQGFGAGRLVLISAYLAIPFLLGLTWLLCRRLPESDLTAQPGHIDGLRAGLAIYIGTFLLNSNWDYRLMFLIFAIPQLLDWSRSGGTLVRWLARLALLTLYASLWSSLLGRYVGVLWETPGDFLAFDETLNWALFALSLILFAYALPKTLKETLGCTPVENPILTSPAYQRNLLAKLSALTLLALLALHHLWSNPPVYNWDLIPYSGIAESYFEDNPQQLHLNTLSAVREQVPAQHLGLLLAGNDYRKSVAGNAESFRQQLPFYSVKPFYPALMALMKTAGVEPIVASTWISALSYLVAALLVGHWLMRRFPPWAGGLFAALLISQPYLINLSRYSTPDALSLLTLLASLLLIIERRHPLGWLLLAATVTIRPDTIIFLALFAGWHIYQRAPHWRWAAGALALGAVSYLLQSHISGNYGWRVLFHNSLVNSLPMPADFEPFLTIRQYLDLYLRVLEPDVLSGLFLLAVILAPVGALSWRRMTTHHSSAIAPHRSLWEGVLWATTLYLPLHWLLHPVEKERTLAFFILLVTLGLIIRVRSRNSDLVTTTPLDMSRIRSAIHSRISGTATR